jgi:hypothetical protein
MDRPDKFDIIRAEALKLTEQRLGPRPTINIIPASLFTAVGVYLVLIIFSFTTGTIEHSGMIILVFVFAIGGMTYWVLRWRQDRWARANVENEMRLRQEQLRR